MINSVTIPGSHKNEEGVMTVSLSSRVMLFRVITDNFQMRGIQIFPKSKNTIKSLDAQNGDLKKISYRRCKNVR